MKKLIAVITMVILTTGVVFAGPHETTAPEGLTCNTPPISLDRKEYLPFYGDEIYHPPLLQAIIEEDDFDGGIPTDRKEYLPEDGEYDGPPMMIAPGAQNDRKNQFNKLEPRTRKYIELDRFNPRLRYRELR